MNFPSYTGHCHGLDRDISTLEFVQNYLNFTGIRDQMIMLQMLQIINRRMRPIKARAINRRMRRVHR